MTIRPDGRRSILDFRKMTGCIVALLYCMTVVLAVLGCDGPGSPGGGSHNTPDSREQTSMTIAFPADADLSDIRTLAVTVTRPEIRFPPAPESTCISAQDVAVGHLNDDKFLDLATVGNYASDTYVAILFGQDGSRFTEPLCPPKQDLSAASNPIKLDQGINQNGNETKPDSRAIVIGDFNHNQDKVVYLATMNPKTQDISVLLRQVNGIFKEQRGNEMMPVRFPVDGQLQAMAMGDFNKDKLPDLVVATAATVTVLIGKDDSSFETGQRFDLCGIGPTSVVVGSFNNDGCRDFATVSIAPGVNTGSQNVKCPADEGSSQDKVGIVSFWLNCPTTDFSDNCSTDCPADSMTQCRCPAEFRLGPTVKVGANPRSAAVGDVDDDSRDDVVVANKKLDNVSILLQQFDGSFAERMANGNPETPIRPLVGRDPIAVAIADLNVDGVLDIVTANESSADVSVLFGRPGGLFRAEERFALSGQPDALTVADLNADGLPDIIATSLKSDNASFVLSTTFRKNILFDDEMNEPKLVTIDGRAVLALSIKNLDVPAGMDRVFTVQAFRAEGVIPIFIGRQDNIDITPEDPAPLVIDLQPVELPVGVTVRPLNTPDIFEEGDGTVVIPERASPVRFRATGIFMSKNLSVETDLTEDVAWSAAPPGLVEISNNEGERGNATLLCKKDTLGNRIIITATVKEKGFQGEIPIKIDCSP